MGAANWPIITPMMLGRTRGGSGGSVKEFDDAMWGLLGGLVLFAAIMALSVWLWMTFFPPPPIVAIESGEADFVVSGTDFSGKYRSFTARAGEVTVNVRAPGKYATSSVHVGDALGKHEWTKLRQGEREWYQAPSIVWR